MPEQIRPWQAFPLKSLTSIRLGWKGLSGTNTLAYFSSLSMMKKKKLYGVDNCCQSYTMIWICKKARVFVCHNFFNIIWHLRVKHKPVDVEHSISRLLTKPLVISFEDRKCL
jgi:hypothetical protein